jgi:hypothetical protein
MTRLSSFALAAAIALIAAAAAGTLDAGPALACDPILKITC